MHILALFLLLPLVEIALFVLAGDLLGFWATLGLVALSILLGVLILRMQSRVTLHQVQAAQAEMAAAMQQGQTDAAAREMAEAGRNMARAAFRYSAGILLIVPGFFSDFVGLVLLLPFVQNFLMARMPTRMAQGASGAGFHFQSRHRHPPASADIIDAEATEIIVEPPSLPRSKPSGWTQPPEQN